MIFTLKTNPFIQNLLQAFVPTVRASPHKKILSTKKKIIQGETMLSQIPFNLEKMKKEDLNREIARIGMIAELDAVNLYEQLATMCESEKLKKVLLEIAREEKTHVGEFQVLLLEMDKEQVEELEKGKKEVKEIS
jgi:rubrerythrin